MGFAFFAEDGAFDSCGFASAGAGDFRLGGASLASLLDVDFFFAAVGGTGGFAFGFDGAGSRVFGSELLLGGAGADVFGSDGAVDNGERGAFPDAFEVGVFRGCALGVSVGVDGVGTTFHASELLGWPPKEIGAFFGPCGLEGLSSPGLSPSLALFGEVLSSPVTYS